MKERVLFIHKGLSTEITCSGPCKMKPEMRKGDLN